MRNFVIAVGLAALCAACADSGDRIQANYGAGSETQKPTYHNLYLTTQNWKISAVGIPTT